LQVKKLEEILAHFLCEIVCTNKHKAELNFRGEHVTRGGHWQLLCYVLTMAYPFVDLPEDTTSQKYINVNCQNK